jgi:hypothetical protein
LTKLKSIPVRRRENRERERERERRRRKTIGGGGEKKSFICTKSIMYL